MIEVYLRDKYQQFTEGDISAIAEMVEDADITPDGIWLRFLVPFSGTCETKVIRVLEKRHPALSRRYADGAVAFAKMEAERVRSELVDGEVDNYRDWSDADEEE